MMFLDRRPRAPGRFTEVKLALFFVGAAVLLWGMAREHDLLVALAIGILGVAFILRFFERDRRPIAFDEEPEEDDVSGEDAGRPPE